MILALNCLFAAVAGIVNLWAAAPRRAKTPAAVVMRLIRGIMALAFAAAYGADLVGAISFTDRVAWGQAVALAAWPLIWILPALVTMIEVPDTDRIAAETVRRLREVA